MAPEPMQVSPHTPADYFAMAERAFHRAGELRRHVLLDYHMAGRLLRLDFAGDALIAKLTPAFTHLASAATTENPALTVSLWDSSSTGVQMPRAPWSTADYTHRGDILGYDDGRYRTSYHVPSGVFTMIDLLRGRALWWIKDATQVPGYVTAMPLLPITHWWMASHRIQLMHCGVVGTPAGGALLAGRGGAGKSGTALACLASGLKYVGDDYCLIEVDGAPRAHSVFCTGRLHPPDLDRLPFLKPALGNADQLAVDKALFLLTRGFVDHLIEGLPLKVILLPRVCEQSHTDWEMASPAAAHRALTAVTLHNLPGAGASAMEAIGRLVRMLPCYHLNLGSDAHQIPAAIARVLGVQA